MAATCAELRRKVPSAPNGWYTIYPSGTTPPSKVYCYMTSKNGMTVIGHNSESSIYVSGYDAPGSYKRRIIYDLPMDTIVAIMKQSLSCEQFIKYQCHHSEMLWGSKQAAWWVSRDGAKMNYWGGAVVDSGKCACGITNTCAGGGNCNCDRNDETWREDSGYLKDRSTLPVTQLRFGDTGSSIEYGYHTLGKLHCWG